MTKTQKTLAGLKSLGWHESSDQPSRKYRKMELENKPFFLFLGKRGSLRMGENVSRSRSITDSATHRQLMALT